MRECTGIDESSKTEERTSSLTALSVGADICPFLLRCAKPRFLRIFNYFFINHFPLLSSFYRRGAAHKIIGFPEA